MPGFVIVRQETHSGSLKLRLFKIFFQPPKNRLSINYTLITLDQFGDRVCVPESLPRKSPNLYQVFGHKLFVQKFFCRVSVFL